MRLTKEELDDLRKWNPPGDPRMFRRFLDTIDAMESEAQTIIADKVRQAMLEGAFYVLQQIRSFRKRNPMDTGAADTLEFVGNLYYQYGWALAASSTTSTKLDLVGGKHDEGIQFDVDSEAGKERKP